MIRTAVLLMALTLPLTGPVQAQSRPNQSDLKPGEYRVDVLEATDGDTFRIDGAPWILIPELARRISVRVNGIDTPEKRGQCQKEKDNAEAATFFTRRLLLESKNQVVLSDLDWDKYGGRVQARVRLANGDDLSERLITMGYATPYKGRGIKTDWCVERPK